MPSSVCKKQKRVTLLLNTKSGPAERNWHSKIISQGSKLYIAWQKGGWGIFRVVWERRTEGEKRFKGSVFASSQKRQNVFKNASDFISFFLNCCLICTSYPLILRKSRSEFLTFPRNQLKKTQKTKQTNILANLSHLKSSAFIAKIFRRDTCLSFSA